MRSAVPRPWIGITSKAASNVKTALAIAAALASWSALAENKPETEIDAPPAEVNEKLPPIRAKAYPVKVVRRSNSNRTYLLEDVNGSKPIVGRILLLKREADNIMAFRILKTYDGNNQFAAKRVRRYGGVRVLESGEAFNGIEKVSDVKPPAPTAEDRADIAELEAAEGGRRTPDAGGPPARPQGPLPETQEYDPELDAGTSPPPAGAVDSESKDDEVTNEEEEDERLGVSVEETFPLDHHHHWVSGQLGVLRNILGSQEYAYFAAGGFRYGLTLGKMIFVKRPRVQDSIVVEGGLFLYKFVQTESKEAYTVMPLVGTLRYNLLLGEDFGLFFYGGVMQNRVVASANGTETSEAALSSTLPAGGGGMLFRVGPGWDARFDLGIDMIAVGLMLRF